MTTSEMSPADIRACCGNDGNNGGMWGGDWFGYILLFALFGGGFGGFGGFGGDGIRQFPAESVQQRDFQACFLPDFTDGGFLFRLAGGKYPVHVYWGRKVRSVTDNLIARRTIWTEETFCLNETVMDFLPMECPTFGGDLREGMIHVIHENGMSALLLEYESHQIIDGKPALGALPSARGEDAQSLLLMLRDKVSGVGVELCYTVYEDTDVIARSARIINGSKYILIRADEGVEVNGVNISIQHNS